jgi:hypothetical protein
MAVAHVTSSQSHASAAFSVSQASFSWTHTTSTDPRGVLVLVFQGVSATDAVTSVTYGGTAVPAVSAGRATDTATEPGSVAAYFLGSGVPTTDNPTVVVNRTNNTTTMWAVCITVTAAANTEVAGVTLVQNDGAIAQQSVSDGSTGVNSMRYSGVYYGGATPAPAGANSTLLGTTNDAGAYGWTAVRETSAGQGARLVGCTQATSDDRAIVALAVREVIPPPDPTGDVLYVDSTTTGDTANVTSRAPAVPAGTLQYDVVIVNLSRWSDPASNPTITPPDGSWVSLGAVLGSDSKQRNDRFAKRLSTTDAGSYNFSWPTTTMWSTAHATAYRGVDRDLDLTTLTGLSPSQNVTANNTGATFPGLTINSVPEGSALHWHGTSESVSPGHTSPTGWTEVEENDCDATAYQESVAAGNYSTGTPAVGVSSAHNLVSMIALPPEPLAGGVAGSATGVFGFTGTASGVPRTSGAATAAFGFSALASGVDRARGAAVAAFGFTATASGTSETPPVSGQAAGVFGFTGTASGVPRTRGAAVGAFGFTGSAAGVDRALGQAVAAFGFTGTASGRPRVLGLAATALGFAGSAAGVPRTRGAAAGSFGFAATALGFAGTPPVTGIGSAALGFTAAAAGVSRTLGSASAGFGFVATASGQPGARGAAVAVFGFQSTANGSVRVFGVAAAQFGFGAAATGSASGQYEEPDEVEGLPRPYVSTADANNIGSTAVARPYVSTATPRSPQ